MVRRAVVWSDGSLHTCYWDHNGNHLNDTGTSGGNPPQDTHCSEALIPSATCLKSGLPLTWHGPSASPPFQGSS